MTTVVKYTSVCQLSEKLNLFMRENPHCGQRFCIYKNIFEKKLGDKSSKSQSNTREISKELDAGIVAKLKKLEKIVHSVPFKQAKALRYLPTEGSSPRIPKFEYFSPNQLTKSLRFWGQLRNFLVELHFLTEYLSDDISDLVYVGGCYGSHIPFLVNLFPGLKVYINDPSSCDPGIANHPRIFHTKGYFDDDVAFELRKTSYKHKKILFISDTTGFDGDVATDLAEQVRWFRILDAEYALVKFDPSSFYNNDRFFYPDGKLLIQPYNGISSNELKLIIKKGAANRSWNLKEIDSKMSMFNRAFRPAYYQRKYPLQGTDGCYDCKMFEEYVVDYLQSKWRVGTYKKNDVQKLMLDIRRSIARVDKLDKATTNTH